MTNITHNFTIPADCAGQRLDASLAKLLPDYSRARLQQWIKEGVLLVNQQPSKARLQLEGGENITIDAPPFELPSFLPEDIPLDILHADDDIIVVNKAVGLVAHPATGNYQGTLLNALLHHFPDLSAVPRAGIIHRLDKETSGVLVVARNIKSHTKLVTDLQARDLKRQYLAVVQGTLVSGRTIETQIGRHPRSRTKMGVIPNGKDAITHFRIKQRFANHTLLNVNLETGRTHQIRVHMQHINHPIVGDQTYGQLRLPKRASDELRSCLQNFKRQALHAHTLGFTHPTSGEYVEYTAPMPDDMQQLVDCLAKEDVKRT